ncbi:MAG: hypothetical protein PHV37_08980 [Candidatus Gastranaerophilales bacterium]|nr:hypothetical protein [Candidatus Gastranaerophilales bacterium]
MIDFENLDKSRIYLGLQYGQNSIIAKEIRRFSKCYAPNSKDIPTHTLAFVYRLNSWWIYESHAKGYKALGVPEGVRRYKLNIWNHIEEKSLNEFKAFPLDIDFENLEHYIGMPYGIGDIKSLLRASIFRNNGKQKDRQGLICSEYIALCYPTICKFYNLPAYCITPAHFQNYLEVNEIISMEG